jgi:carboxyl-terminal processing protease
MPSSRRSYFVVPAFIAVCSLAAGLFFGGSHVKAATVSDEDQLKQSLKAFTKVYDVVEANFADSVKPEKAIYKGAIPGMLRTLDPHSNFFDPKDYKEQRSDMSGHYSGVGMMVGPRNDKTIVLAPFAGYPAYKAGLRAGDVLLEIDDKKTDGLTTTEIAERLKGMKGTKVQIKVQREGSDVPITFNITRADIERSTVPDCFFIRPGIAYMDITQFGENTSKEMEEKLAKLPEGQVKGLILDLRQNPGGLLPEAVDVAGHFLKRGEVVVSHHGRMSPNKNLTVRHDGKGVDYPVVVLVNRYSASAAEIVSGALQDHDRAWIVGENTFGKGLVQTVFQLSDNTGLALTTMQYYTPSGRFIQRPYANISFLDYYYHNNLDQKNTADVKMTDSGRTVYGGGGITPDEKYSPPKLNKFQIEVLFRKYAIFNFSSKWFSTHDTKLPSGWSPDDKLVSEFHDFLQKSKVQFTEADFNENRQWIKDQLKREMYITAFSYEESQRVAIEQDPMVVKGIEALPKAKALLETAKKQMVQRMNGQEQAVAAEHAAAQAHK